MDRLCPVYVDIRESLCQPPVSLKLRRAKLKWLGHVKRTGDEKQVKKVTNAEMEGKRPVGRPRTMLKDVIQKDMESIGLRMERAALEAREH